MFCYWNYTERFFKNSNFSGLDFSGQNFKGVNVAGAKFIDCNLPANISKAKSYQFAIYDVSEDSIRKRR